VGEARIFWEACAGPSSRQTSRFMTAFQEAYQELSGGGVRGGG